MKKALSSLAILVVLGELLIAAFTQPVHNHQRQPFSSSENEQHILRESKDERFSPNLTPVLIYEVSRGMQHFAASGVCTTNAKGEVSVLTAAHTFFKKDAPTSYYLREICPVANGPSWWIKEVIFFKKADIAFGKLTPFTMGTAPPIITAECDPDLSPTGKNMQGNMFPLSHFEEAHKKLIPKTLRSLTNGKEARVCGTLEDSLGNQYLLGDSGSVPGESGSGYVDTEDNLYLLIGSKHPIPPEIGTLLNNSSGSVTIFTSKLVRKL